MKCDKSITKRTPLTTQVAEEGPSAKLSILRRFGDILGSPLLERLVSGSLFLAAMVLLAGLITGGYQYTVGPLDVSVRHLRNPLLVFLALGVAKAWLQGESRGLSAVARLKSPLMLVRCLRVCPSNYGTDITH